VQEIGLRAVTNTTRTLLDEPGVLSLLPGLTLLYFSTGWDQRKGFGFWGAWTVCEQNRLLHVCFGLPEVNKI
jgi:hypothetical protein